MVKSLGKHIISELYGCNPEILNNEKRIEEIMNEAASRCGSKVINSLFHKFNPYGVTGVVIIEESHLTIHTWPEHGYAAVDIFTCGDKTDPRKAYEYIKENLYPLEESFEEIERGKLEEIKPPLNPFYSKL